MCARYVEQAELIETGSGAPMSALVRPCVCMCVSMYVYVCTQEQNWREARASYQASRIKDMRHILEGRSRLTHQSCWVPCLE
jgi:hypothetical protein